MSEKLTRDEWYKWVRENPEKCTMEALASNWEVIGVDMVRNIEVIDEGVWNIGVFARPGKKKPWLFDTYTVWYSTEWDGFLGTYEIRAPDRREADRLAKEAAERDLANGKKPKGYD